MEQGKDLFILGFAIRQATEVSTAKVEPNLHHGLARRLSRHGPE